MKKRILCLLLITILLLPSMAGLAGCASKPKLLSIVYDGSYLQKRYAHEWAEVLADTVEALDASKVGVVDRELSDDYYRIELCKTDDVEAGWWYIERTSDKLVRVYAADGYGFVGASRYFANVWKQTGAYTEVGAAGSYLDTLTELEQATAYAYDRQGEYRVMFYNVLWDNTDKEERITLNANVVNIYQPDVLGLQEMKSTKRGDAEDGKGGLIAELAQLGYVEAIDPRVKNFYDKSEKIPGTDASLTTDTEAHVELNGYGTGGGTKVTVNGETFYTFFNCAPLLYNTKTTRLIEADYYWYKNQWDTRTGQTHDNSAGDCASKAATWGVFEDIDTGDRYIAISTHMCTRSDYIRGLQGQEMIDLIAELTEKYDCPVILGGDYNGTYTSANYKCFEENGLIDVEKNDLASLYTTKTRGHHTYPAYNEAKESVQPAPNDNTGTASSDKSVDHIMITNVDEGEMDIFVFGVVIDDNTLSGADHFPMYMDFSIQS